MELFMLTQNSNLLLNVKQFSVKTLCWCL